MKFVFAALASIFLISFQAKQDTEYVCMPCGQNCDHTVYRAAGTCPGCGMALVEKSTVKFKDLSIDAFCARLAANPKAVLLDVRSPGEFGGTSREVPSYGHFKNAININVTELEKRVGELAQYKDQEVLVYCSHSHRSPRASYFLSTHGFKDVKNMAGGVSTLMENKDKECLKTRFVYH